MPPTIMWFHRDLRLADNPAPVGRKAARPKDKPPVDQPWTLDGGQPDGYPDRIADHDAQRKVALARYAEIRSP